MEIGDKFPVKSADVHEGKTKPPQHYTEDTLDAVFDVSSADPFDVQVGNIASWLAVACDGETLTDLLDC